LTFGLRQEQTDAKEYFKKTNARRSTGLYYFVIHATPTQNSKYRKRGGAYVSCWVNFPHQEGALVRAKHYIQAAGWRFRALEERKRVTRANYRGEESLQYYDEAAKDGSSFVFHMYPKSLKKRFINTFKARCGKVARP
jgi:hypothetical protein